MYCNVNNYLQQQIKLINLYDLGRYLEILSFVNIFSITYFIYKYLLTFKYNFNIM